MKIDARFFGEYAITGAFFWLAQYTVLLIAGLDAPTVKLVEASQEGLPTVLRSEPVLAVLALVGVFFTGLLLDLFSRLFVVVEMTKFRGQLARNECWLQAMVDERGAYFADDYRYFVDNYRDLPRFLARLLGDARTTARDLLRESSAREPGPIGVWKRTVSSYRRIEYFLYSFLEASSKGGVGESLREQTRLWRVSRALAVALNALALVAYPSILLASKSEAAANVLVNDANHFDSSWRVWAVVGLVALALILAFWLRRSAYTQMCFQLFSLVYVAADEPRAKGEEEKDTAEEDTPSRNGASHMSKGSRRDERSGEKSGGTQRSR